MKLCNALKLNNLNQNWRLVEKIIYCRPTRNKAENAKSEKRFHQYFGLLRIAVARYARSDDRLQQGSDWR